MYVYMDFSDERVKWKLNRGEQRVGGGEKEGVMGWRGGKKKETF